jgi:hypothetical protein
MGLAHSNHKAAKDQQRGKDLMSQKVVRPSLDFLGGTGAGDDESGEEADTALTRLGDYEGSDAENGQPTTSDEADTDTDGLTEDDDDVEGEPGAMVDPATLLAMMREAQKRHGEDGESEEIDYGESDGDS